MARDFNGTDQGFTRTSGAMSFADEDFTVVGRFLFDAFSSDRALLTYGQASVNERNYRLHYDSAADRIRFSISADGSSEDFVDADIYGSPDTGIWLALGGWHDATADEIGVFVDGNENTASYSGGCFGSSSILYAGFWGSETVKDYFDGGAAELAIFSKVLSAEERTAYATGHSPLLIAPDALIGYWRLLIGESPPGIPSGALDWWAGPAQSLVPSGSFPGNRSGHPPMVYPGGIHSVQFTPGAISSDLPAGAAAFLQHRRRQRYTPPPRRRDRTSSLPPLIQAEEIPVLFPFLARRRSTLDARGEGLSQRRRRRIAQPVGEPLPGAIHLCPGSVELLAATTGSIELLASEPIGDLHNPTGSIEWETTINGGIEFVACQE